MQYVDSIVENAGMSTRMGDFLKCVFAQMVHVYSES